tara:strand:- start:28 stop:336 length:309 start_codon:yes stop_codon:yes gene_type:complete
VQDFQSTPEAISHKQLKELMSDALKSNEVQNRAKSSIEDKGELFNGLLIEWNELSLNLLSNLKKRNNEIFEGRSDRAKMALGALEAHLTLACEAYKATGTNY